MPTLTGSARILLTFSLALVPNSVRGQKTDWITLRNGNQVLGEMKGLERGRLEFSTSAMGTVRVEWPRVVTVDTDKIFEVVLIDGSIHIGSLESGTADSVVIRTDSVSLGMPTQSVVRLTRIKPDFWHALDGNLYLGIDFTQQNAKTDLDFGGEVWYVSGVGKRRGLSWRARGANLTRLRFSSTFGRQDSTDDIVRIDGSLTHARQYKNRWFFLGVLAGARNSQLSLEARSTFAGGLGRLFVESNKVDVSVWVAPAVAYERFAGEVGATTFPLILAAELLLFIWEPLDLEVRSQLGIMPILSEAGRWRIDYSLSAMKELVSSLNLNVRVKELFDSRPPSADANKNDLSFTISLGWKF